MVDNEIDVAFASAEGVGRQAGVDSGLSGRPPWWVGGQPAGLQAKTSGAKCCLAPTHDASALFLLDRGVPRRHGRRLGGEQADRQGHRQPTEAAQQLVARPVEPHR